ncbi:hybrid sensor histidine kinase/response regulator [Oculatella sp. FACHB-28]|uniref:hybrid sensor histidine kinase/response regulator n=1 Tax=Oculatella sp. FACHB-28 TaxID=2692845 RepID=UPI00168574F0|nr:hybrid sensor histidine kinase/response regulator [Oculatella sp. FACHB-28]MBD2055894.1 hybrid sensor histidine kinase/response regulator [Oculatella sp. FACHB-28]
MAINPDIRDQAYQFFIQEAPELLQVIESGLLTLQQERNTTKVHNLMRAAHSIKGGAASVGLEAIATLAHRLENIFKALYSDSLIVDAELEDQLLQAYDCLRLPLMLRITMGSFDAEQALAIAEPIFSQIEERFGDALTQTENYIPSSSDLGVDMISSILEIDVAQGLERLAAVVANPQNYEVAGELRAQVEVFAGFAELMNLSEFEAIAETVKIALNANPDRVLEITKLAMADFERSRQAVLAGGVNQLESGQGAPSEALIALTVPAAPVASSVSTTESLTIDAAIPLLQDIFGDGVSPFDLPIQSQDTNQEAIGDRLDITQTDDQLDLEIDPIAVYETICEVDLLMGEAELVTRSIPNPMNLEEPLNVEWVAYLSESAKTLASSDVLTPTETASEEASTESFVNTSILPELQNVDLLRSDISDNVPENIESAIQSIEQIFDRFPQMQSSEQSLPDPTSNSSTNALQVPSPVDLPGAIQPSQIQPHQSSAIAPNKSADRRTAIATNLSKRPHPPIQQGEAVITPNLTVRVGSERLERMNNLVGELAINRDGLSLQNEQLQTSLKELLSRFARFRDTVSHLRELSDQMLVEPERRSSRWESLSASQTNTEPTEKFPTRAFNPVPATSVTSALAEFDPLEMDSYGALHTQIQEILEDIAQLEETVDDVSLFAGHSNQILDQQRSMLTQLRDELIWARMFPLGEVINRFPRMIRDLSTTYHKPVALKLSGAGVLVDKAILERLFDPLLHLLRNAFDHGIEPVNVRQQRGKPEQGQIEIRAYHKGNQTIIQVRDDGQGLDLNRIRSRAIALGWIDAEQAATLDPAQLYELIFEPGFSTARQVTELSGRGVGLDVVRSQLRLIKGTVTVTSTPGRGTIFTLYLPLTLTIAKLVICLIGPTAVALPADSIEEILNPQPGQVRRSGTQRYLNWREQIIPTYRLADLLSYSCPLPENPPSKALSTISLPKDWSLPMLVLRQEQQIFALEVDRLVTEQELVIKPFGLAIAPPSYAYGCTILGDGSLVPVIDGAALLALSLNQPTTATLITAEYEPMPATQPQALSPAKKPPAIKMAQSPTVLIIDDSATLRRTAAISLERAGFRVTQARDGREAIDQLQHATVQIIVCDIEMPNMNGFEFLSQRRKDAKLVAIPIVMLTSRSNEKHRWLANQLGASAYFTKPYLEQEFITTLKNMLDMPGKALAAIAQST